MIIKREVLALILAGLSALGTVYIELTHTDQDNANRIATLEAHQSDTTQRLDRIENKLDRLLDGLLKH